MKCVGNWGELEQVVLSKAGQTQKDRRHTVSLTDAPGSRSQNLSMEPGVTTDQETLHLHHGFSGVLRALPMHCREGLPVRKDTEASGERQRLTALFIRDVQHGHSWGLSHLPHAVHMAHDKCRRTQNHKPLGL